jgi:hypothetical protein
VSEHRTHRTRSQIIIAIPHRCFLLPTISWPCQKSDRRGILLRQNQPWTLNISTPNNPLLIPTHHLHLPMPHTSSHPTHSYFQPPPEIWSHDLPHPRKLLLPDLIQQQACGIGTTWPCGTAMMTGSSTVRVGEAASTSVSDAVGAARATVAKSAIASLKNCIVVWWFACLLASLYCIVSY